MWARAQKDEKGMNRLFIQKLEIDWDSVSRGRNEKLQFFYL